eukprot:5313575-Amphidinium_carterae.1
MSAFKVQTIKPQSIASDWNADNPTKKVEEGCYIVEINGSLLSCSPYSDATLKCLQAFMRFFFMTSL